MKNIVKVAAIAPKKIAIGNPRENAEYIKDILNNIEDSTQIVVFPELCLTGYSCGDLFGNQLLIDKSLEYLKDLINYSNKDNCPLFVVGIPIRKDNGLYNCGAIINKGKLLALIPKTYLPNYNVFYDMRNFKSSKHRLNDTYHFEINNEIKEIPFSPNVLIKGINNDVCLGIEICEDLWVPIAPSRYHCLNGANIILNLSASNETIGKAKYRKDLLRNLTSTCNCGYVYASASSDESTTDNVFSGHLLIAENGNIQYESSFPNNEEILYGEIDIDKCMNDRYINTSYMEHEEKNNYKIIHTIIKNNLDELYNKKIDLYPFVPKGNIDERAKEVINIQAKGLAQRLSKINCKKVVLGISGGLDSTLALLVSLKAFEMNNYDKKGIIGITMPCFGTTKRTKNNSIELMEALGITSYEIDIKEACNVHYKDINHDPSLLDITFENVQARERTQVLMDMANKHNAIVVGTGDLSELALGWCTYNGDHMSMYGVNASIPKTLIRYLVNYFAKILEVENKEASNILKDILNTPVSPELLPPNEDGTIKQITENSIGSYVTHDFIMYYMLRFNFTPSKIYKMYLSAIKQYNKENGILEEINKDIILKDFKTFYNRFFSQQFKRNCLPDGVKVGSISLSPRGDWKMPSDANRNLWLEDLNNLT